MAVIWCLVCRFSFIPLFRWQSVKCLAAWCLQLSSNSTFLLSALLSAVAASSLTERSVSLMSHAPLKSRARLKSGPQLKSWAQLMSYAQQKSHALLTMNFAREFNVLQQPINCLDIFNVKWLAVTSLGLFLQHLSKHSAHIQGQHFEQCETVAAVIEYSYSHPSNPLLASPVQ